MLGCDDVQLFLWDSFSRLVHPEHLLDLDMADLVVHPGLHLLLGTPPSSPEAVVSSGRTVADSWSTTTATRSHSCFENQEVRFGDLESIEASLEAIVGSGETKRREDIGVEGAAVRVDQLNNSLRVRIFGNHICGKDVPQQIFSILRLQLKLKWISDGNCGGWSSLVLDQKTNSAVKGVLGWKILNGNRLT